MARNAGRRLGEVTPEDRARVKTLATLVARAGRRGARQLSAEELRQLPHLYRFASSLLARLETSGEDQALLVRLRPLLLRAHGLLHRGLEGPTERWSKRLRTYWLHTVPGVIRGELGLVAVSLALLYGLATIAYLLVSADLPMAYSLLDPRAVDNEIAQLRALPPGEAFRGNFTFGLGESAQVSGTIMGNNMKVAVLFFALALAPPLYAAVLATNALMLGTYTAVAGHWGQALNISSILWCHGTLELQAIVLSGTGGLLLLRPLVAPGPFTRRQALRRDGQRALAVLAATFPMLFLAGVIEGFVSPHASLPVRLGVAALSGALLVVWIGRASPPVDGPCASS